MYHAYHVLWVLVHRPTTHAVWAAAAAAAAAVAVAAATGLGFSV